MTASSNFIENVWPVPYTAAVSDRLCTVDLGTGSQGGGLESRLGMGRGEAWRGCVRRGWSRAGRGLARLGPHAGSQGRGAWPWQEV